VIDDPVQNYEEERLELLALVEEHLVDLHQSEEDLLRPYGTLRQALVLLFFLILNGVIWIFWADYIDLWIVSSFLFLMLNPFLLLIPEHLKRKEHAERRSRHRMRKLYREVKGEISTHIDDIMRESRDISEIGWNMFFVNFQPLVPGVILIFALNIVLALYGAYGSGVLSEGSVVMVLFQSVAIIIFYLIIQIFRPYSPGFFGLLLDLPEDYHQRKDLGWIPALKFVFAVAFIVAAVSFILVTVFLLPRWTLEHVMTMEQFAPDWRLYPLILLFFTQVTLVRFLQGIYSRKLLLEMLSYKIQIMEEQVLQKTRALPVSLVGYSDARKFACADRLRAMRVLTIKTEIYTTDVRARFGIFPVWFIMPNLGLILGERGGVEKGG
jgi:hypothetical protein